MNQMIVKMIQVMILLAVGRMLNRKAIVSDEAVGGIRKLVINLMPSSHSWCCRRP
ncbi:MAG: hypothetical protein SCK57_08025 [Bacillota bacterium]|nr:hypothetical protein [Bacillota bacterium]MDW7677593.1 hypothetical protein [Bacillota bacterium]